MRNHGPNWKGGRYLGKDGYWNIYYPNHVFAQSDGYVKEHRLIYEQYHNCILLPYTVVHHIDDNRQNNVISNLKPLYRGQHITHHKKGKESIRLDMSNRKCLLCSNNTTYLRTRDKRPRWHLYKNGFICGLCYYKVKYGKKVVIYE